LNTARKIGQVVPKRKRRIDVLADYDIIFEGAKTEYLFATAPLAFRASQIAMENTRSSSDISYKGGGFIF
jgi:hypothetical protein